MDTLFYVLLGCLGNACLFVFGSRPSNEKTSGNCKCGGSKAKRFGPVI